MTKCLFLFQGNEDDADKPINVEDEIIKNEVDELEPNITLLKEGKHQINRKTKEKVRTFRPATPGSKEDSEKKRKLSEGMYFEFSMYCLN